MWKTSWLLGWQTSFACCKYCTSIAIAIWWWWGGTAKRKKRRRRRKLIASCEICVVTTVYYSTYSRDFFFCLALVVENMWDYGITRLFSRLNEAYIVLLLVNLEYMWYVRRGLYRDPIRAKLFFQAARILKP